MGLLEKRWAADKAISGVEAVGNIIDKVHTNDKKTGASRDHQAKTAMQTSLIQAKIIRAQASHHSWFVTSARPFLLWICSLGFLFSLVIKPLLQ